MSFIWDAKNNFILLHSITLHDPQSSISTIDWPSIVNDINLEISSTPLLLKHQYEYLLETFYPKQDSKSLHTTLKHIYLHSLCQRIEDDLILSLESVYELVRHARSQRIHVHDIEQLLKEWNFNSSSDEQKKNKERLFTILHRLRDYIQTFSINNRSSIFLKNVSTNEPSTIQKATQDADLEPISDSDEEISTRYKQHALIKINNHRVISNTIIEEEQKPTWVRRRTRSLTIFTENKNNKVNIGIEWFVPKLKRQQRSSSLHGQCQSSTAVDSSSLQNRQLESNGILLTTIDNDESSNSTNDSNVRQTHTQPAISWLPLTNEQIAEKERQQTEFKLIDDQQLDQVSSTDSESIEIQWSSARRRTTSSSSPPPPPHDLNRHQQDNSASKRQRLS